MTTPQNPSIHAIHTGEPMTGNQEYFGCAAAWLRLDECTHAMIGEVPLKIVVCQLHTGGGSNG